MVIICFENYLIIDVSVVVTRICRRVSTRRDANRVRYLPILSSQSTQKDDGALPLHAFVTAHLSVSGAIRVVRNAMRIRAEN